MLLSASSTILVKKIIRHSIQLMNELLIRSNVDMLLDYQSIFFVCHFEYLHQLDRGISNTASFQGRQMLLRLYSMHSDLKKYLESWKIHFLTYTLSYESLSISDKEYFEIQINNFVEVGLHFLIKHFKCWSSNLLNLACFSELPVSQIISKYMLGITNEENNIDIFMKAHTPYMNPNIF